MKHWTIKIFWFFVNPVRKVYWFIFRPKTQGVKCLVENNSKFLFVKLNYAHHKWTTPGGGVKRGESFLKAAIREVKEETGIDVINITRIGSYESRREYKKDIVEVFWANSDRLETKIDQIEIERTIWFERVEIPKDRSASVDKVFKMYDEYKNRKANTSIYLKLQDVPSNVILPGQIHGDNIVEIITGNEELNETDALMTKNKNFSLGIRTADCAPVCFSDGEKIGIAHVGWRGLCLGLIEKMLKEFNPQNLKIFIGPFNHSFEIQKDFCFDKIQEKFGNRYFKEKDNKITFLFKDAIMSLLPPDTEFDARNTFEDLSLPSFRRDKTSERLVTVISFK